MPSTQNPTQTIKKKPHLFFDNGDIIVAVQQPHSDVETNVTLFKLHRRVLATHAKAFSNLLAPPTASPTGVDPNEYYEGIPVVRLFDDPTELARFFTAMYAPATLALRRYVATNATKAYSLLLLADKYVADDMECMLECQMRQDWPKNVYEWDAFENRAMLVYRRYCMGQATVGTVWDELVPEPASYIRLARLAKVPEPTRVAAAFYMLSRMHLTNDWEKNCVVPKYKDPTPRQLVQMRRAMWSLLTEDEMHRMERGRERVADHFAEYMRTLHTRVALNGPSCEKILRFDVADRMGKSDDALADLLELCDKHSTIMCGMCETCRYRVSREARSGREWLFDKLPEYFEVGDNGRACTDVELTSYGEHAH